MNELHVMVVGFRTRDHIEKPYFAH